jgi:hypothetical protein
VSDCVSVHPQAAPWTNNHVHNYNKLASLFDNNRATREKIEASADVREIFARMNQPI